MWRVEQFSCGPDVRDGNGKMLCSFMVSGEYALRGSASYVMTYGVRPSTLFEGSDVAASAMIQGF
jgi:hypothetical protein